MKTIARLQDELNHYKTQSEALLIDKRTLEQANDDLERRERELSASIHDLSEKVDSGTEKGVIVSLELEETRKNSQEIIQRLKDEIRGKKKKNLV